VNSDERKIAALLVIAFISGLVAAVLFCSAVLGN
jgi:hypothetical protein